MSILGRDIPNEPPNLHLNHIPMAKDRTQKMAQLLLCWNWFSFILGRGRNGRTLFVMEKDFTNIVRIELCPRSHWKAYPKDQSWSSPHPWGSVLEIRTIKYGMTMCCFPQFFSTFVVVVITVFFTNYIISLLRIGSRCLSGSVINDIDKGTFRGEKKITCWECPSWYINTKKYVLQEVERCHSCMLSFCISCEAQHVGWSKQGYTQIVAAGYYELK